MNNKIIYDYLTFTSKIADPWSIIDFLGFDITIFEILEGKGRYFYRDCMRYNNCVNIYYGGRNEGVCVELSGKGCRAFESLGNGDYDSVFDYIISNYDPDPEKRNANITRLDIAYDDFNNILDLYGYYVPSVQRGEYVSRCKRAGIKWDNIDGCTVYHGSERQSDFYLRMYDKLTEQLQVRHNEVDPSIKHWVRCEIQLKQECALGFIKLKGDIRKNYFDVLNNYLRYVIPSDNTTNKSMLPTSPEWLNFIETWESVSIFDKPGMSYNLMKLDNYITKQLAGPVSTLIDIIGVDKFLKYVDDGRKHKPLNPKYKELMNQHGSAADNIMAYLHERGLD